MIILGIDPGSRITGYGLVTKSGSTITHLDNGAIDATREPELAGRLKLIYLKIRELIVQFQPTAVAIESIFYAKNVQSTVKLGHARGVAMLAATQEGLPLFEYSPLSVKQAVVGYGGASKEQVQKMVKSLLKLPQIAEANASDALAIALCHAQSEGMQNLIKKAMGQK